MNRTIGKALTNAKAGESVIVELNDNGIELILSCINEGEAVTKDELLKRVNNKLE